MKPEVSEIDILKIGLKVQSEKTDLIERRLNELETRLTLPKQEAVLVDEDGNVYPVPKRFVATFISMLQQL